MWLVAFLGRGVLGTLEIVVSICVQPDKSTGNTTWHFGRMLHGQEEDPSSQKGCSVQLNNPVWVENVNF